MSLNQAKHKDIIVYPNINEFASYFDIRLRTGADDIGVMEKEIKYSAPFYIHSWKENKYLSINVIGMLSTRSPISRLSLWSNLTAICCLTRIR